MSTTVVKPQAFAAMDANSMYIENTKLYMRKEWGRYSKPEDYREITPFGHTTISNQYVYKNETTIYDIFTRVFSYAASNEDHAQRLYNYACKHWFSPATPVLSNCGTARGNVISCFLNEVNDSMTNIRDTWFECVDLARKGGGIGTNWSKVRSVGENIGHLGKTSGIIPFLRVQEALTLAVNQGALRRGNAAVYLDISHPEIEEFIEMRKPTGGDPTRKILHMHHGVMISDEFMIAVENNTTFALRSPATQQTIREVSARSLWIKLLTTRLETGEPYLVFADTVNKALPEIQKILGLKVTQSNLCSEITLPTGIDHLGNNRTAVCCLSSLNLEFWDEWKDDEQFIPDVMEFIDNCLQIFIDEAGPDFAKATYSAMRERSIGMGVMGFHALLQKHNISFEGLSAKGFNKKIFKHIRKQADAVSKNLARERGACPDAIDAGKFERFSNKIAIAPTASISIICGETSAGIEPFPANVYKHKVLNGEAVRRNVYLEKVLESIGKNTPEVWLDIMQQKGSVQHLDFLTQDQKDVFKTFIEIDPMRIIDLAADRAPFVDQAQSINIALPADIEAKNLHKVHMEAWKRGVKSLYYCRSLSLRRAENATTVITKDIRATATENNGNYEECTFCQ